MTARPISRGCEDRARIGILPLARSDAVQLLDLIVADVRVVCKDLGFGGRLQKKPSTRPRADGRTDLRKRVASVNWDASNIQSPAERLECQGTCVFLHPQCILVRFRTLSMSLRSEGHIVERSIGWLRNPRIQWRLRM